VPVVDLHVDLSYQLSYRGRSLETGVGQYRAADLLRAGVIGVVLPLYVPRKVSPDGPRSEDLESSYQRLSSLLGRVKPYAPAGCAPSPGQVRTWFAFEGAAPLASDPDAAERWTKRNARLFGLVHTYDNALASSSGTPPSAAGLSRAGRELVRRVHAAGGIVDVSHASDLATQQILTLAEEHAAPVVATHSNARALTPHPRNLSDAQIAAIARSGGVVGINFHARFLTTKREASLADVVRHIQHVLRVAGPDHVAIGSDFEGDIRPPAALASAAHFPKLAGALRKAGVSADQIERVFSKNALRVLCQSERSAPAR
jgi:membrane dipeptidase